MSKSKEKVGNIVDEYLQKVHEFKKPSEGYFLAKRQIQEKLCRRISIIEKEAKKAEENGEFALAVDLTALAMEFDKFRSYIRNVMLWDTKHGE